ncbi:alkaline shock response membrane anchor protein AmaP [Nocardia sp. NPDC050697]|uniref:alkaline shock response membrane anchor protein AmaP n=1 Tax=Nocardia sp. NPDC050697 TaxID=3155158 RepID=UPI0033EA5A47
MNRMNRPAAVNRSLIGLAGLALLAAGGYALAAHDNRLSWVDTGTPLVPGTGAPPTWVFVAVIAGAALLGLLCLRWLLAQPFRKPKSVGWQVGGDRDTGRTVLRSGTAAVPVAADIEGYPGVRSAQAWLSGGPDTPQLHLLVTAAPAADVAGLRRRILGHAVTRLRTALEIEIIPVTLELRFADEQRTLQ